MLKIPKKVVERFAGTLKGYQGVVADIKARDVSEALLARRLHSYF